jgi:hypothetical protein
MTATPNSNCTTILITSSNFRVGNISNTLLVSVNGADAVSVPLEPDITDYTFAADSIDRDTLEEGTYYFTLSTVQQGSETTDESICAILVCSLKCSTQDLYKDVKNIEKILAWEALKVYQDCVKCSCTDALMLYNIIKDLSNVDNCGCESN